MDILSITKAYLKDLELLKGGEEIAHYFSKKVQQIEYPNRLNPNGGLSDYNTLLDRSLKARNIIVSQRYDISKELVSGNTVVLEILWSGIFSIPIGKIKPGDPLKANFAMIVEFEEDKIVRQANYDCFEAF